MLSSWHDLEYQKLLVEVRAQFDALFADSPDAIYVTDPHLSGNLKVTCNRAFLDFHGLEIEQVLGYDDRDWRMAVEKFTEEDVNRDTVRDLIRLRRDHKIVSSWGGWKTGNGSIANIETTVQLITLANREMMIFTDRIIADEAAAPASNNVDEQNADGQAVNIASNYLHYLSDGVVIYDPFAEGRPIVDCNFRYGRKTGFTREELIGRTIFDFSEQQDEERYQLWLDGNLSGYVEALKTFKVQFSGAQCRKDGSLFNAEILQYLVQEAGRDLVLTVVKDLTEVNRANALDRDRNRVLEQIAQDEPVEEILKAVAQMIDDQLSDVRCAILLLRDKQFRLGAAPNLPHEYSLRVESSGATANSGAIGQSIERREPVIIADVQTELEWQGDPFLDLNPEDRACWVLPVIGGGAVLALLAVYCAEPRHPGSEEVTVLNTATRLAGIAIEQRILTDRLAHQAEHDVLTGLPNRLLFHDRLQQSLIQSARSRGTISVFFLDLDGFKHVNDTLGHAAGDLLLQQVARRLESCVRASDTVARIGGDEFTLILRDLQGPENTTQVARKIIDAIRAPFHILESELFVTVSIGIALSPLDGDEADLLIRNADAAMYRAKESGKNRYEFYEEHLTDAINERQLLKAQLRQALERDEFELYYEPQIDLQTQRTICLEALIRWKHPRLGIVLPLSFIPAAEESGLILKIGEWVLDTACRQLQLWKTQWRELAQQNAASEENDTSSTRPSTRLSAQLNLEHLQDIRISVNISALQFGRSELFSSITRALGEHKLAASSLELELTESLLMQNVEESVRQMQPLRALGVRIAVDDFGTGYSSLSYLQKLPIDVLKIDRSFVHDIHRKEVSQALVQAIVTLGHTLNLQVLAEGVELAEEAQTLRELCCDSVQGFLLAPPLPPQDVTAFLLRNAVEPRSF